MNLYAVEQCRATLLGKVAETSRDAARDAATAKAAAPQMQHFTWICHA